MKKIVLCAAAAIAALSLNAETLYQKVTTTPEDWIGTYLIVCEGQNVVFNGAADETQIDSKGTGEAIIQDVAIADNKIVGTTTLDAATFTISATEDTDWPWAIQSASGLYIGHKDTIDNGLSVETELKGKCKHTLAIDESGNLIATPKWKDGAVFNLQYNKKAEQLRFRYFVPADKQAIQIYKQQLNPTAVSNLDVKPEVSKTIENGRLVIIRNGQHFSALGY